MLSARILQRFRPFVGDCRAAVAEDATLSDVFALFLQSSPYVSSLLHLKLIVVHSRKSALDAMLMMRNLWVSSVAVPGRGMCDDDPACAATCTIAGGAAGIIYVRMTALIRGTMDKHRGG
jgi:hypothetical protein